VRWNSIIEGTEHSEEALWKGVTSKTRLEMERIIIKPSLRDLAFDNENPSQDWIEWALLIYVL